MEAITSAATEDLISRAISFLFDKLTNRGSMEEKLQRLQLLLLRVRTVVDEADGRCITNSGMLVQLKLISKSMYQGYCVLDNFKYRPITESDEQKVSSSSTLVSSIIGASTKRFRMSNSTTSRSSTTDDVDGALRSLETMVDTMKEFVILIGGCERVCHNPYDTYLYIDTFMFGRHVEKQQIINTLLQKNLNNQGAPAPAVLAIIGGNKVGKRTLVSHVCNTDKIRSHFSSILHISGHDICGIQHEKLPCVRTLVVIEFTSDVNDDDWMKFYSCVSRMGEGTKVIVISRLEKIARFGTAKPIHLKLLSQEEFSYLFKVLAFGSTNPEDNPLLSSIANELAKLMQRSFLMGNILADVMRENLNTQFWLHLLKRHKWSLENNMLLFGDHPRRICLEDRPIDITKMIYHPAPLRILPHVEGDVSATQLPRLSLGDLIVGSASPPKKMFELMTWESRLPPYSKIVKVCVQDKTQDAAQSNKKQRRGVAI